MFEGIGRCDEAVDKGCGIAGLIDESMRLAGQGPGGIEQAAPEFAAFPEPVVAGVVAEAQEQGQGNAEEGKGGRVDVQVPGIEGIPPIDDRNREEQQQDEPGQ